MIDEFGKIPKKVNFLIVLEAARQPMVYGVNLWIMIKIKISFVGIEAGGPKNSKKHAAPLSNNSKIGVLHGSAQMVCQG